MGQCLQYEVPLERRASVSELVFEGTVGSSESFWAPDRRFIYTVHRVSIHRLWKGNLRQGETEVLMLTLGGRVGDTICRAEPALELQAGQRGVFFAEPPAIPVFERGGLRVFQPHADGQGFARFNLIDDTANDLFTTYKGIETGFIPRIEELLWQKGRSIVPIKPESPKDKTQATPAISNFSPTTVTAGTGTVLTINGSNFGATPGKVQFGDADQAPGNFIDAAAHNVVSWNDSQIRIRVPYRAGTGRIRVVNATNETSPNSPSDLTVTYNLINAQQPTKDTRIKLIDRDSTGGFLFVPASNIRSNAPALAALERALSEWRCKTNVNFQLSNLTTAINCDNSTDGINVVGFAGASCPLGAGKLGVCFSQFIECNVTGDFLISSIDLLFVPTAPNGGWNFGPGATTGNRIDFESVALHELGHAHQLGHVINAAIVMNFSLDVNTDLRTLNAASDVAGGTDVLTFSATGPGCGVDPMIPIAPANCLYDRPRIQFEKRLLIVGEETQGTNGCRGFRDHTVNLTISGSPAQAVTVNLAIVNGTAYAPADLELVQTSVNFPAGSAATRSFTLRVWDDVAIETAETAQIVATVAAGSAAFFSENFDLTVQINDNDDIPGLLYRETFEPGNPRLGEWGNLKADPAMPNEFIISLNSPIAGVGSMHITNNTATAAYQYTTNDPTQSLTVALSPVINATGISNINAAFKYRVEGQKSGSTSIDYGSLGYSAAATPTNIFFHVGNPTNGAVATPFANQSTVVDYVSPVFPAAVNNSQFHVAFLWKNNATGGNQPPWMFDNLEITGGVSIQTALANRTQYLGPFGKVYYLTSGGNVMACIENLTDHDYGCTDLSIDRAGTGAVVFQNPQSSGFVTIKTFRVTPTNPNPTGRYRITLFYTTNEITSWETATGRSRTELNILRSPDPIPSNVPAGSGYGTAPLFDNAYGGHFVSAEFNSGFSGFAASISTVDGPLPLTDFTLTGSRTETAHLLEWEDDLQAQAMSYALERQDEGGEWLTLAEKATEEAPRYLNPAPLAGWNRYRARAFDVSGATRYSNLIELYHRKAEPTVGADFRLYPNPGRDLLTVETGGTGVETITLYDALGRRTLAVEGNGREDVDIDVRALADGLYQVVVVGVDGERRTGAWWKQ